MKGLRKILISVMCALCVTSGAVAYQGFNNSKSANADTVTVSQDIQSIIDALDGTFGDKGATTKYVQNYQMANGGTASGILMQINVSTSRNDLANGLYDTGNTVINLPFDITNMTGDTNPFAGVIFSPDSYPDVVTNDTTALQSVHIGLHNVNSMEGFAYTFGNETAGDGSYLDKKDAPDTSFNSRVWYTNGGGAFVSATGSYWPNNTTHNYNTRARVGTSINGYSKTPFNMYYDYATNTGYKDIAAYPAHESNTVRLVQMWNVNPKQRTSIAFDNKYLGKDVALKDYTGSQEWKPFNGFENGKARASLRYIVKAGKDASILFTSFMGVDLTNPNNVATNNNVLAVEKENIQYLRDVKIDFPKVEFVNGFTGAKVNDFTGVVNVYKGSRNFVGEYGSYGAPANANNDSGLTLVASNINYADGYTFTEDGAHVLEFVQNGKKVYKQVNVVYDAVAATQTIGSVSIDDVIANLKSTDDNFTVTRGSATTVGSNKTFSGLKLNITKSGTITFDKVMNVSGFTYTNRIENTPIIGLLPIPEKSLVGLVPKTSGEMAAAVANGSLVLNNEFKGIKIILTDAHDETNKVEIRVNHTPIFDGSPDGPSVDGNTYFNSQVNVIAYKGNTHTNDRAYNKSSGVMYGSPRQFSFFGYQQDATNFIYDGNKNAVYTNNDGNKNTGTKNSYLLKMLGVPAREYNLYNDPDNGGKYTACNDAKMQDTWSGFTNGEVKLSIEATLEDGVESGNLMITNLFGLDLTGTEETAEVKAYSDYPSNVSFSETIEAGEFAVPSIKLANAWFSDYESNYAGNVEVALNGAVLQTVPVGSNMNLTAPGVYSFTYSLPGNRKVTYSSKLNGKINLSLGGDVYVQVDGKRYRNGDVIEYYKDVKGSIVGAENWVLGDLTFGNGFAYDFNVVNENAYSFGADISVLPLEFNLSLIAREKYTLKYYVQGKLYDTITVEQGENAVLPNEAVNVTGYNFICWNKGSDIISDSTILPETANYSAEVYEINAYLTPIIYIVNVDIEESFKQYATLTGANGYFTIESDLNGLPVPVVSDNSLVFAGWYYKGKLVTKGSELPCVDGETVYACLTKAYNTVTYKEGNVVLGEDKIIVNDKVIEKQIFKDGYVLEGWYKDSAKTQKYVFGSAITSDITLYANWVKVDSTTIDGTKNDFVDENGATINGSNVGAFHNANAVGIITLVLTVLGLGCIIAIVVMYFVKKRK